MAYYAFLDENNVVTEVISGKDEHEKIDGISPEEWYGQFRGKKCVRTSYNGNIRKQFAGIGFTYDSIADVFIAPQPFSSWALDDNHDWQAPIPRPRNDRAYDWDENNHVWVERD